MELVCLPARARPPACLPDSPALRVDSRNLPDLLQGRKLHLPVPSESFHSIPFQSVCHNVCVSLDRQLMMMLMGAGRHQRDVNVRPRLSG